MCTRDHLQKQCSFPRIRVTLKPKSKTLKMLCVLNTVYTDVYIYMYSYSILFIFFSKTKKCTSLIIFDCFPPPKRELEWLTLEFVPNQFLNLWRPGATSYIPCIIQLIWHAFQPNGLSGTLQEPSIFHGEKTCLLVDVPLNHSKIYTQAEDITISQHRWSEPQDIGWDHYQ